MEYGKPPCPYCTMPGCAEEGNMLACVKRTRKRYVAILREKKKVEDAIEQMRPTHWGISMKELYLLSKEEKPWLEGL